MKVLFAFVTDKEFESLSDLPADANMTYCAAKISDEQWLREDARDLVWKEMRRAIEAELGLLPDWQAEAEATLERIKSMEGC